MKRIPMAAVMKETGVLNGKGRITSTRVRPRTPTSLATTARKKGIMHTVVQVHLWISHLRQKMVKANAWVRRSIRLKDREAKRMGL
jgi:hypothetical protein